MVNKCMNSRSFFNLYSINYFLDKAKGIFCILHINSNFLEIFNKISMLYGSYDLYDMLKNKLKNLNFFFNFKIHKEKKWST